MMKRITLLIHLLIVFTMGTVSAMGPDSVANPDLSVKPTLLWKVRTNAPIVASPVAEAGKVFVGGLDSLLYAIDINTGKVLWKLPTGGAIRSEIALTPQRLYLLSSDGLLYRVSKENGTVDGTFQTATGYIGDHQNDYYDYYTSTPVISESNIYFGSGEHIYGLSVKDGLVKWTCQTGGLVHTRPAITQNTLFAGSFDGNLYAVNIQTGQVIWKFKSTGKQFFPKGEFAGNPVTAGGMVFAGARDYNLYAIDIKTGTCNWMKSFPKGWSFPLTVNDSVLLVGTSEDRTLFALDIRTGIELWKTDAGFNIFGGVAISGKNGCFSTLAGKLTGVDLSTGKINWTLDSDGFLQNHLHYMKENGHFRDDISKIIRTPLDLMDMYKKLGGVFSTPVIYIDKLIVTGYDGWIYCYSITPSK